MRETPILFHKVNDNPWEAPPPTTVGMTVFLGNGIRDASCQHVAGRGSSTITTTTINPGATYG